MQEQTKKEQKHSNKQELTKHKSKDINNYNRLIFSPSKKENKLSLSDLEERQRIALTRFSDSRYEEGISTFEDSLLKGSICKQRETE